MAIQLNPAPPREAKPLSPLPAANKKRLESHPRTVLRVPEIAADRAAVVPLGATAGLLSSAGSNLGGHAAGQASSGTHDCQTSTEERVAARRSPAEMGRDIVFASKARAAATWQAIEWPKIFAAMGRPVVTYSSAVVIVLVVIVAIVMHPRVPASPESQKVAESASSTDEVKSAAKLEVVSDHRHEHDAEQEHAVVAEQPSTAPPEIAPAPRDEVVKLPPVISPGIAIEANLIPQHEPGVAGDMHSGETTGSTEQPNVARLEGRILTPQIKR